MITLLGPTATGKTSVAVALAAAIDGEIISADARQVYRGMDLGTGKDLSEYTINGRKIPYHLIDIVEPGYEYNVFEFQRDFRKAYDDIIYRNKMPILCGGSGMYIESVLLGYDLIKVPESDELRKELQDKTDKELTRLLKSYKSIHNVSDISERQRLIRAIEIQEYYKRNPDKLQHHFEGVPSDVFGIYYPREEIRQRITRRLEQRLNEGMIEEVEELLKHTSPQKLMFYGLEYKYLTLYVTGQISREEMFSKLNTAIHQFAKRQMTWFRRMGKRGIHIQWIDGSLSMAEKVKSILANENFRLEERKES